MNLKRLSPKDYYKINDLPILLIYRNCLKLVKTYPSIKKVEMKNALIEGICFYLNVYLF